MLHEILSGFLTSKEYDMTEEASQEGNKVDQRFGRNSVRNDQVSKDRSL